MHAPSGTQFELSFGELRACAVEVGGGLRTYAVGDRQVLDGYGPEELARSARGQVLAPWPNRLEDGTYSFDGESLTVPLSEPGTRTAIHGLVRWRNWSLADRDDNRVALEHVLHPSPGYPFVLALRVDYHLGQDGLTVTTSAENLGERPLPFGVGHHPYLRGTPRVDDLVVGIPAATRSITDERALPVGWEPVARSAPRLLGDTVLDATFGDLERDADGLVRVRVGDDIVWLDESYPYLQLFTGDPLPDVARRSLAVEPMTCPPNAFRSGEGLIRLDPGERFVARWGIQPLG